MEEFDRPILEVRRQAKRAGMRRSDITIAIAEVCCLSEKRTRHESVYFGRLL